MECTQRYFPGLYKLSFITLTHELLVPSRYRYVLINFISLYYLQMN